MLYNWEKVYSNSKDTCYLEVYIYIKNLTLEWNQTILAILFYLEFDIHISIGNLEIL